MRRDADGTYYVGNRADLAEVRTVLGQASPKCRFAPGANWHEPDEYDVSATVIGRKLDNACGSSGRGIDGEQIEKVVVIKRGTVKVRINLASLLAWATGYEGIG
jgi:hypothetical protein